MMTKLWLLFLSVPISKQLAAMTECKIKAGEEIETKQKRAALHAALYNAATIHPASLASTYRFTDCFGEEHAVNRHPAHRKPRIIFTTKTFPQVFYAGPIVVDPQNPLSIGLIHPEKIVIWDSKTDGTREIPISAKTNCITWSLDGRYIAVNSYNCMLYDSQAKKVVTNLLHTPMERITAAAFTPNCKALLTANTDEYALTYTPKTYTPKPSAFMLRFWCMATKQALCTVPTHEDQPVQHKIMYNDCRVAFHPDGCHFAVGLFENPESPQDIRSRKIVLQSWKLESAGRKMRKLQAICFEDSPKNDLKHLEFNAHGSLLLAHVTAGVIICDAKTLKYTQTIKNDQIIAATFTAQGDGFVVIDRKGRVKQYKLGVALPIQTGLIKKGCVYARAVFSSDKQFMYLIGGKVQDHQEASRITGLTVDTLTRVKFTRSIPGNKP